MGLSRNRKGRTKSFVGCLMWIVSIGTTAKPGGVGASQVFSLPFLNRGRNVEWTLRLVAVGGKGSCVDIMEISKPDDLGDIELDADDLT
jgi:hypothetical protein